MRHAGSTDAEILEKLDATDNPVTRSVLKDVCVARLRDRVKSEQEVNDALDAVAAEAQKLGMHP